MTVCIWARAMASVVAMDAASGREVWRQTIGTSPIHAPAVANGTIVVASDAGDAKALDPATGAVRWTTHVSDAGIGTPVIAGDLVFIGAGADSAGSRLVALDLASGTERWHDDRFLAAPAIAATSPTPRAQGPRHAQPEPCAGRDSSTATSVRRRSPATRSMSAPIVSTRSSRWTRRRAASCGASTSTGGAEVLGVARGLVFVGTSTGTVYAIGGDGAALTAKAIPSAVGAPPRPRHRPTGNSATAALPPLPTKLLWAANQAPPISSPGASRGARGKLWAAEGFEDSFAIFNPDGTYVEAGARAGNAGGQFDLTRSNGDPYGMVAFAEDGSFFVLEPGNHRVRRSAPTGSSAWRGATSATIRGSSATRSASRSRRRERRGPR